MCAEVELGQTEPPYEVALWIFLRASIFKEECFCGMNENIPLKDATELWGVYEAFKGQKSFDALAAMGQI